MTIDDAVKPSTDLEERLRRVEDLLEIGQLVAAYGPAVDGGATTAAVAGWVDDGTYTYGTGPDDRHVGHEALTAVFDGPGHRAVMEGGSAHIVTPPAIEVDGDDARGVGYSILFRFAGENREDEVLYPDGGWTPVRVSSVHWTWRRVDGAWRTVDRTNRLLTGAESARALFTSSFDGATFRPRSAGVRPDGSD